MLLSIRINNFALIDRLELDLAAGLNVLTGETGAGKSIILDAIDVILGGKANGRMIRQGAQRAILEATFRANQSLGQWLQAQEIDLLEDNSLVCSRELVVNRSNSLRSRSRINGVLVNRSLLNQLRDRLVEITAQGQTVQLLVPESQTKLLDAFGGESVLNQRQQVKETFEAYSQAEQALSKRQQSQQQRLQRLDLINYQLKELEEAALSEADELDLLEQMRDRLIHVVELQNSSYEVYQILYQNDSEAPAVADLLTQAQHQLTDMVEYDASITPILEMVQSACEQVIEAGQQINYYGESLEADPQRLEEVNNRIRILKNLCRKYGSDLAEVIHYQQQLQDELEELTGGEQSLEVLEATVAKTQKELLTQCQTLTQLRSSAAVRLQTRLVQELKPLAMERVLFECRLQPTKPGASGAEQIVFYFSPNAGETVQPLATIASGGEMSRFLLALKSCFADAENDSNTLVFDEIDAGVSGKVAEAIAQKLYQLGKHHQVLCVTHQPLVAAMADAHYRVTKQIIQTPAPEPQNGDSSLPEIRTVVRVQTLQDHLLRREELAQLTGGHSAQEAIAFVDSLLTKADGYRRNHHKKKK